MKIQDMIRTKEHAGGYGAVLLEEDEQKKLEDFEEDISIKFGRGGVEDQTCFNLKRNQDGKYTIETSYIIGINWIKKGKLPIKIDAKVNEEGKTLNFLKMLFEALEETENAKHLEHLYVIDHDAPKIMIDQQEDQISPLLAIQYLQVLKKIVKKGLKKSYYKETKNLNAKVKGKILLSQTIKKNHSKAKYQNNYCQYEVFGYDTVENRLLKKAFEFAQSVIVQYKLAQGKAIREIADYIRPAFEQISSKVEIKEVKNLKKNPFYRDYDTAIKIAKHLLQRFSFKPSNINKSRQAIPPHWIDMSKLFEMFVFKKLKEVYTSRDQILYEHVFSHLKPDFVIPHKKLIIDAKYKEYASKNIRKEDGAQVSGYGRLKTLRQKFKIDPSNKEVLPCLIIYPNTGHGNEKYTDNKELWEPTKNYLEIYKYGLKLPFDYS